MALKKGSEHRGTGTKGHYRFKKAKTRRKIARKSRRQKRGRP